MTETLPDWPAGSEPKPKAGRAKVGIFPPPWWKLSKPKWRNLAYAGCDGSIQVEGYSELFRYGSSSELRNLLGSIDRVMVYMSGDEFARHIPYFLRRQECCWSDSAEKIVAFRVRFGRTVRYIFRASAWAGLEEEAASWGATTALAKLRRFLDDHQVGDQGTPGALGLNLMYRFFPAKRRQFRPPWAAWQDLYDNLIAGRTELLEPFSGKAAVELDINNAYAAGIAAGVPAGRCWRIFCEEDGNDAAWWYGHWRWTIDPGLPGDAGLEYGRLGVRPDGFRRRNGAKLSWPTEPGTSGEGWYTADEIRSARDAGYRCEFLGRGWGWEEVRTDFAEWASWLHAAKTAYQDRGWRLEAGWLKQCTVAAIGRLGMDRYEKTCWRPEDVGEQEASSPLLSGEDVALMLTRKHCASNRGDLLIHVCVQVHAYVRAQLVEAQSALRRAGAKPCMSNIDCFYVPGRRHIDRASLLPMTFGPGLGEWKQKSLQWNADCSTIEIQKPGWVIAGNLIKTPGVPHDPHKKLLSG